MLNSLLLNGQLWQGNFHSPDDIARARVFYENYVALAVSAGVAFSPLVWNNISVLRDMCGDASGAKTALNEVVRVALGNCGVPEKSVSELSEAELAKLCEDNLNVTLLYNYGVFSEKHGDEALGQRIYEAILKCVPQYYDCVLREAKLLMKRKQLEEAESKLKTLSSELGKQLASGVSFARRNHV